MTTDDRRAQEFALRQQTETLAETMRQAPEQWGEMGGFQRITTAGHLLRCQQLYASGHLTEFPEREGTR
jgi:hypothetical protein